jgi:hypothetical protein
LRFISTIFTLLFFLLGYSQTTITGKLLNVQQQPIAGVSVSYKKVGAVALSGFSKTDNLGKFELSIKFTDADSIQLDFSHMSYAKKSVVVANRAAKYVYILRHEVRQIEEVKAANIPIYRRKDTISYSVDAFTSKQDRVIADIIKKLPGIEMIGDQIMYHGKPIQQYRVNDLDLMGGRYGMINQNLPADAVKNVQILENHQPIKMLDSLVFSDKATLNLQLKKYTTTGTGQLGLGGTPVLWDAQITPMTFAKKFQALNSFQTNNIGLDVAEQLQPFYTESQYFISRNNFSKAPSFLTVRNISSPEFDEKRWLDNQIFLMSSNTVQKLKNGLEIKGNFSYYHDDRKRNGGTQTTYYVENNIIENQESVNNSYGIDVLDLGIQLEKNEKDIFLKNITKYNKKWNRDKGNLISNEQHPIEQQKKYADEALLNSLSLGRFVGKQLVNIRSTLEWHRIPQRLTVRPGQFEDLLNHGHPFEQMNQMVKSGNFAFENGLSFSRRFKKWTLNPSLDINYTSSTLKSYVQIKEGINETILGDGYVNDMYSSKMEFVLGIRLQRESQRWKQSYYLPNRISYYYLTQHNKKILNGQSRFTWNPTANITYLINGNGSFGLTIDGGRDFGGIENFFNGYIINQYRSIQRYQSRLLKKDNFGLRLSYKYNNIMKGNFASFDYSFRKIWQDYVFNTVLDSMGRGSTMITDRNSKNILHQFNGSVSHLFAKSKTVFKLTGMLGWSQSDYLLNERLINQLVQMQKVAINIINNYSEFISGDYRMSLNRTKSSFQESQQNEVISNNHFLNIAIFPFDKHTVELNNSLFNTNVAGQNAQYFLDATYRYRIEKWRTDIELSVLNISNNRNYLQQYMTDYQLIQTYFEIRPRQFLVSMKFKL